MPRIHPTAIVDPLALIGDDVSIGAYSIIKGPVRIGDGTVVHEHSHLHGKTTIGQSCQIGPAAYVGLEPQHLHADPNIGQLIVGDHVIIRETATIHRSTTAGDDHATRIGDHCFLMGGVHIAHDCVLNERVIAANSVIMGGHCQVGAAAFLGGGAAFHQFVRIGRLAIISGNEPMTQDMPPFGAQKNGFLKGYNAVGCKRAELSNTAIRGIRAAFRILHSHRVVSAALVEMEAEAGDVPEVREIVAFIRASKRGIVPSHSPTSRSHSDEDDGAVNGEGARDRERPVRAAALR
ncbi:MAG TPA: acyl-ACP--UDP-N-acetylglucosamine O-acyltransferase [Tepidisphaeraceae bacterium]|nr:acyl-ACP--UDP-N-acetylglucosamine O-acyltransferase [Tepidisphaeraceae bacterium]